MAWGMTVGTWRRSAGFVVFTALKVPVYEKKDVHTVLEAFKTV